MNRHQYNTNTSFLDLLCNTLLAFVALFTVALVCMAVKQQNKANVESKAEFLVTITWPNGSLDDVDSYVEDPEGHLVCFRRREDGLMHLDRDDQGSLYDRIQTQFGVIECKENKEVVTLRSVVPGEYVVNVHAFAHRDKEPTAVKVQVDKINPYSTVCIKETILSVHGEEKTLVRFTIDKEGKVTDISTLEKKLTTASPNEGGYEDEYGDGYQGHGNPEGDPNGP